MKTKLLRVAVPGLVLAGVSCAHAEAPAPVGVPARSAQVVQELIQQKGGFQIPRSHPGSGNAGFW